jgi:hypothetical protein
LTDIEAELLPEAFLRTYTSARDWAHDRHELERQGYVVWSGVAAGEVNQAVYVGLHERSLYWYFGTVFDEVRTIVNTWDPYGLLHAGAPSDEYEAEVSLILLQLGDAESEAEATEITLNELTRSLGCPPIGRQARCQQVAEEMWQMWRKHLLGDSGK